MGSYAVSPRQTIPLVLTVSRVGVGGISGESPTVQLLRSEDGFFLDWDDNTFKNAGWVQLDGPMTDIGGGRYLRSADLSIIGALPTTVLVAYYTNTGANAALASDSYSVEDLELIRQAGSNRLEETQGNPGKLRLYEDDGVTLRATWDIRDSLDGGIVSTVGTPAKRSAKS